MKRERYIEDYEDFEPEMRTWPFVILSFLIPVIPLVLGILADGSFSWFLCLEYVIAVLPLFSAALSMRDGGRSWMLIVSSALYSASVLLEWSLEKFGGKSGYPLGIPFILALSPGILPLASYAFFSKRKRANWVGWALVSFLFSLSSAFVTWKESGRVLLILYPGVLVLLSIMLFFVTRRTESTPWYITIPLVLLVLSSFTLYPGFCDALSDGTSGEKISAALKCFMYSFPFWYTLSFLFVFSSLAGKSSYRKEIVDDAETENTSERGVYDDIEETVVIPSSPSDSRKPNYTNPPGYSRFDQSPSRREETREEKTEDTPLGKESVKDVPVKDDKWYDFIEGGVKNDEGDRERGDRYDERSREERRRSERRYDERDYYRRRDERYDDRDRYYRDDRRYDERYDDRDRYYRDDRRYDDRIDERDRDYRRDSGRRYDDDDYYRYDERDRRR